jgi:tetratricopeptide (TPR) repeat protein
MFLREQSPQVEDSKMNNEKDEELLRRIFEDHANGSEATANPVRPSQEPGAAKHKHPADAAFKKGDVIGGEYTIHKLVGRGGFGEVYLAHISDGQLLCALKTIRSDLLPRPESREAFKKEALLWVNLEEHPFISAALGVDEFSRRLFVIMDYVAPDADGRVSLADHLACTSGPLDPDDSLKWAVQFCYGMEHSFQRGIKCHRDIKPTNILIAPGGNLKISDFGLALAAETSWKQETGPVVTENGEGGAGLSLLVTDGRRICGTPGYIAPELLLGGEAGVQSDIYSFGLVLWQMAKGSQFPPFHIPFGAAANIDDYLLRVIEQQIKGPVPNTGGPMQSAIERSLAPEPSQRYESFGELRLELEGVLRRRTGRTVEVPEGTDCNSGFWTLKGMSLNTLGRHQDAIFCFDKAIGLDRHNVAAWSSKGNALVALARLEEAMTCYDEALRTDPKSASAWNNKGNVLLKLRCYQEALTFYANALEIDSQKSIFWTNKGRVLYALGRYEEALTCFDKSVQIDPHDASAWTGRAITLGELGRLEEARTCQAKAAEIDPLCLDDMKMAMAECGDHDMALDTSEPGAAAWAKQGITLAKADKCDEAVACFAKALEIDPRYGSAWHIMGSTFTFLGRHEEALACYNRTLDIDPLFAPAWDCKGQALNLLERYEEAEGCLSKALELDPGNAASWNNKGDALRSLNRLDEALACYTKALEIDPGFGAAWYNKGTVYSLLGWHEEAVAFHSRTLEIHPTLTDAWERKGDALWILRRYEEAVGCFDTSLQQAPEKVRLWYKKGRCLKALGRLDEALSCIEQALEIYPRGGVAWDNKGTILRALGRYEEALDCYSKAVEIFPRNPYYWGHKGETLAEVSRFDEAIECFDKALEIDPDYTAALENKRRSLARLKSPPEKED